MLKFYKSLILIAISISCSYSTEGQKLKNNINSEDIFNNIQNVTGDNIKNINQNKTQFLQHKIYKKLTIKNMAYNEQQSRSDVINKFQLSDNDLQELSKCLLSHVPGTNETVIDYIRKHIIFHRPRKEKAKDPVTYINRLTTIGNISKGDFNLQFERNNINNIELEEEQQNIKLSNKQKKNISFLYANYLLRYFFSKSFGTNELLIQHNISSLEDGLSILCTGKEKAFELLCKNNVFNKNQNNTPFHIIVNKMNEICGSDKNKLDILVSKIITETSKHYQIDKNNNILYRSITQEYQEKYRKEERKKETTALSNKVRAWLYKKIGGKNNPNREQELNNDMKALKEIAEQYRDDKVIRDELQVYIDKIENIELKKYAKTLLNTLGYETLMRYIKQYANALDKEEDKQNKKSLFITTMQNNKNQEGILSNNNKQKEKQNESIISPNENEENIKEPDIEIIIPEKEEKNLFVVTRQDKESMLLEKGKTNKEKTNEEEENEQSNYDFNNSQEEDINISYDEENRKHISIGNKRKKYNVNKITNSKNHITNVDPYSKVTSLNFSNQIQSNNNQNILNNSLQRNNNISSLFNNPNNNFLFYNNQNMNQDSNAPRNIIGVQNTIPNFPLNRFTYDPHYKITFNKSLNNNTSSNIFNNNFVPYQVQLNHGNNQNNYFNQSLNNNTNSMIFNNNVVPYQVPTTNKILIHNQNSPKNDKKTKEKLDYSKLTLLDLYY